jgi:hypothetical protein
MLQHPTSRPTRSTHDTIVNASKKNFSPHLADKYGNLTKMSKRQRHQANKGKSDLVAERIRALGALRSLRFKRKLAVE